MASNALSDAFHSESDHRDQVQQASFGESLRRVLRPLASLRLTVALFALAIFLIFAGTLAQVEKDIWEVMALYFRRWVALVPLRIFVPSFVVKDMPAWSFPFPGGFMIGGAMAVNLLAAHGVRFTVQASGRRLAAGLAVIAIGVALTWLVVMGGSGKDIVEGSAGVDAALLWNGVKAALAVLWGAILYAVWKADPAARLQRALLMLAGLLVGGILGYLVYYGTLTTPDPSAMRILWQLVKATSAALVLLAGCILVFRKRAGIVLLHAGIGLMMANELVVYGLHSEGTMRIGEGDTSNYVEDIRTIELAVTAPAGAEKEDVTVIPKSLLLRSLGEGQKIASPWLPFDIEVQKFYQNSALRTAGPHEPNPATAGAGKNAIAEDRRPVSGVESSKLVDLGAAYLKLTDKQSGHDLGTWLASMELRPQTIEVGGEKYELALRFKRDYKPYSVQLIDVAKNDYVGTKTAQNYSSDVVLADPEHDVNRKIHIWMNNPLRYAGETFYQSGYNKDASGREFTTLQVVRNTGWMIPYMACMVVAVGLFAQFGQTLVRFLRRRDAEGQTADLPGGSAANPRSGKQRKRNASVTAAKSLGWPALAIPAVTVLVFTGWLAGKAVPPKPRAAEFELYEFGKLPVVYQGRFKPIDTLARNSLTIVSQRQEYKDAEGKTQPAIRWLLDVISRSKANYAERVFRIDNLDVLDTLKIEPRESHLYSIDDIEPQVSEFEKQSDAARAVDVRDQTAFQKELLELDKRLHHYTSIVAAFDVPHISDDDWAKQLLAAFQRQQALLEMGVPLVVPPSPAASSSDARWEPFAIAWTKAFALEKVGPTRPAHGLEPNPATESWKEMLSAYRTGNVDRFNQAVASYRTALAEHPPANLKIAKIDYEAFFNHFEPFYWALYLDGVAFLLTCLAWFGYSRVLNRTALWLLIFTLAVHTVGLVSRIYISGRPPVTNLYSSAVFIGWGAMILGIAFESIYRLGIGNLVASVAGFATLLIAHYLSLDGDTLIVMEAVLDTQFWLATHVVCVTLGYATTYVAGLLGIVYVLRGTLTGSLSAEVSKDLGRMIYGTLCFALFFSFVGTVLGGLWADDSWGRFWGWDPKENGALIIVLWNALVLHARWGAMVKDRGLAVLALGGNIVTSWSWFGVNQLGVGLHSYGFTSGVALVLLLFVGSQLAIIALGLLPKQNWASFRAAAGR
jgi:ABC-type transport system involved in cytochrome c biogenesis permease subunit